MSLDVLQKLKVVSIHAFRGEGDRTSGWQQAHPLRFQSTPSGGKATGLLDAKYRYLARFNPRLPGGRRLLRRIAGYNVSLFQSTPSGGKATANSVSHSAPVASFNPRLPGGRRLRGLLFAAYSTRFQSTPSGGKATIARNILSAYRFLFQSTPSGGKATRYSAGIGRWHSVSIHAFRGEGDQKLSARLCVRQVSIHAFRGEGDNIFRLWLG